MAPSHRMDISISCLMVHYPAHWYDGSTAMEKGILLSSVYIIGGFLGCGGVIDVYMKCLLYGTAFTRSAFCLLLKIQIVQSGQVCRLCVWHHSYVFQLRNKLQSNCIWNSKIFTQENAFINIVRKMSAICFGLNGFNTSHIHYTFIYDCIIT